ncbi:MAG TPA: hypothetical protein VFM18_21070 [Methanosarcina sp.]|nr:hypothetical protein [Methanosarcina sp.]
MAIKNNSDFPNKIFVEEDDAYNLDENNHPERFIVIDRNTSAESADGSGGGGGGLGNGTGPTGPGSAEEYNPGFDWAPNFGDIPEILNDFSNPVGTVRTLEDGSLVVDLVVELTNIPGATRYELRIAAYDEGNVTW